MDAVPKPGCARLAVADGAHTGDRSVGKAAYLLSLVLDPPTFFTAETDSKNLLGISAQMGHTCPTPGRARPTWLERAHTPPGQ